MVLGSGICVSLGDAGVTEQLVRSDKHVILLSLSIVFAHLCSLLPLLSVLVLLGMQISYLEINSDFFLRFHQETVLNIHEDLV